MSQPQTGIGEILIVDDTPDNLRYLSYLLIDHGYNVRKALNGQLALDAAQLEPPDLILLDVRMPHINGYQVCERLKSQQETAHIPIIFLSALANEDDKIQAFQVGGIDYITKPFHAAEVLVRVETHLKLNRLQKQLQEQTQKQAQEIQFRIIAENELQILNQTLEDKILERTSELETKNKQLLQLQADLQKALSQEQKLNELRADLITTISHEFRTPLSILTTAIALLNREQHANHDREKIYFHMMTESIKRLNEILQNVLTLAEITPEDAHFNPQLIDLTCFCQQLIEQWQRTESDKHQLVFTSHADAPALSSIDVNLFQEIWKGLLTNAIRYSPQGGTIQFELLYEAEAVVLRVHDQGIGIPVEDQNHIFDRFYRAGNANLVAGTPGIGLGLAVVKQAVERHRGTISVSSTIDQGSTFTVRFPRVAQDKA
ncbi:MAG: hybrid sensor histidine kinase/response regulator [Scytolyngbya sp. HA4215-MV1]|nr:hybrid sensor histidine kinase/response regulator [Scytolyngbya sp. HA4215-MV1]